MQQSNLRRTLGQDVAVKAALIAWREGVTQGGSQSQLRDYCRGLNNYLCHGSKFLIYLASFCRLLFLAGMVEVLCHAGPDLVVCHAGPDLACCFRAPKVVAKLYSNILMS